MGGTVGGMHYMICNSCHNEIVPISIKAEDQEKLKEELKEEPSEYQSKGTFSLKSSKGLFIIHFCFWSFLIIVNVLYPLNICSLLFILVYLIILFNSKDEIIKSLKKMFP